MSVQTGSAACGHWTDPLPVSVLVVQIRKVALVDMIHQSGAVFWGKSDLGQDRSNGGCEDLLTGVPVQNMLLRDQRHRTGKTEGKSLRHPKNAHEILGAP